MWSGSGVWMGELEVGCGWVSWKWGVDGVGEVWMGWVRCGWGG